MMKTPQEYLQHARSCETLANTRRDPKERRALLVAATKWRRLAKELELKQRIASRPRIDRTPE